MIIKKQNNKKPKTSIQKLLVGEDRSQQEGGIGGQTREMGGLIRAHICQKIS